MTKAVLGNDGWTLANTWGQSAATLDLYRARAEGLEPEMICSGQGAEILAPEISPGDSLLDVGCAAGHFRNALESRGVSIAYHGIDPTESFVEAGRQAASGKGGPAPQLQAMRIEDLSGAVDHAVSINVLSYLDNYHRPLERLLQMARKTVLIRESLGAETIYRYVEDRFLDPGPAARVYVNTYGLEEVRAFVHGYGFETTVITDRYSGGDATESIGYPHYWTFLLCRRA